jgi:hypothetical protein
MDEGFVEVGGRTEVKLLTSKMVWLEVPESVTQSVTVRGSQGHGAKGVGQ